MTEDGLASARLTHGRLVAERERIRSARQFFARQLGPLPAATGGALALVAAFSDKVGEGPWLELAGGTFALMIVASIAYSRMPSYREIRAALTEGVAQGSQGDGELEWYLAEIALEERIYGEASTCWRIRLPVRKAQQGLQCQLDRERFGVFLVQALFLGVVGCLVVARSTFGC